MKKRKVQIALFSFFTDFIKNSRSKIIRNKKTKNRIILNADTASMLKSSKKKLYIAPCKNFEQKPME
ncbi:MAG: hypothetical protein IKB08_07880 [Clostridia bacterium]|nr:hypothetical protein [Clostridia bacterium]